MAENVLLTLVRLLLPLTLMFASLARPVAISILYSALFLASPWLMQSRSKSQRTVLKFYLIFTVVSGGLFSLGHLILNFTSVLFSIMGPSIESVLRQIGFVNFHRLRDIAILHWILPDIMVTLVALIILVFMKISKKLYASKHRASDTSQNYEENVPSLKYSEINRLLIMAYIQSIIKTSPIFSMIMLYFAATLRPSLPGSLYFLVFIVAGTYWALYRPFNCGLHYPLVVVIVILTMHIICFLIFQQPIVNKSLNGESIWARIIGLEILLLLRDGTKNGTILEINNALCFDSYLNPIALMCAYFIIILNIVHHEQNNINFSTFQTKINQTTEDEQTPDEVRQSKSASQANLEQPSTLEQFYYMITDVTSFIYKNSYILLNIIMMIWSIIYHSWLTFVFLIWANILWMIPNQRRTMMRSSFFVVLYAEFLIITQYIFGLNLNESELPTKIQGVNIEQIGFVHPRNIGVQPFIPLTVKMSFLFIFWITSHQYFKEKAEDNDRAQYDILQQLFGQQHPRSESTFFEKSRAHRTFIFIFESVSNFITRIWMWMLIFLIFLCAMLDKVMTAFRICYMSLFLLFLMVFQMSLPLWIKFLYGYWMFVIFYAMTILTIIYTYQFDYFDYYWEKYLHVQPALQTDIGLRRYQTRELFLHLLVPTLTVIFTVIQLHYFHRRFMRAVLHPGSTSRKRNLTRVAFTYHKNAATRPQSWRTIFLLTYRRLRATLYRWIRPSKLVAWRFLEMHMIKAVAFFTFVCAISEICCFNLWLVILALISVCVNRLFRRIIFRIVSFWISVLILMKMIYQINYLHESHYDHICGNTTVNFANWMGLRKTGQTWGSLIRYLAPYIVYMIVTTLHAVVKLRDHLIRYSMGEIRDRTILFPQTSRQDAERNFSSLLKYLLNYGYFKFGLEITLIALVASIAHRRDVLAVTYVLWLILLLCLKRMQCARIWYIFQLYFVISIFVQYVYVINFPPNLCLGLAKEPLRPTNNHPFEELLEDPTKSKLLLDFIVLLFISRQRKAFKAEVRQMNNLSYPGGDNRNIVHNIAKLGHVYFKNPTHDFCSFVRNYSDVFKTVVFCSFLWITLAIVFMGGVCSMDMLSLGYLIFALVFLLQGSEVYLQNIHYIICRWNILIAFNVFNIVIKVCIIVFANVLDIKHKQDYQSLFAVMEYNASLPDLDIEKQPEKSTGYHYGPNSLIFKNILVWHAIIFAFIIFQSRIFRSYYFCHIISDTQANTVLASRGAIIIENLHYKQIYDRREYENNMLENVKTKMEIIKANNVKNYKRLRAMTVVPAAVPGDQTQSQEGEVNESTSRIPITSAALRNLNLARSSPLKRRDLRLHPHAVRSGDYYMFDDQDDGDEPILNEEYDFLDKEDMRTRQMLLSAKNKRAQSKGPSQLSSDSDIDFETNPLVKLTSELIMLVTLRLNRLSRNFRFVHKVLSAEKKTLQDISTMNRLGMVNTAAMFSFLNQSLYDKQIDSIKSPTKESPEVNVVDKDEDFTTQDHNDFVQMLISMWYAIIANSEVISYLAVFINQVANSSIISLPMPFLVLYWGALTLPRPTKTFWVTLITYTLGMIFIKCIMHQKIVLDQKLIKIAKTLDFELFIKHGKAVYDLLLLVVLIWHRYMLKKQGIWNIPRSGTNPLSMKKSRHKERPQDVLNRLRQESGNDLKGNVSQREESTQFERDMDDLLRPGIENKYVYENIESEYYRTTMNRLEQKGGILSGIKKFFVALLHKARLSTDVYTLLFLCDFINFFVLLFGYPKFVYRRKYTTSVLETYIQGNRVPLNFLLMLFIQFATIVAERAIYLRKAMMAKIVFHFCTVVGIHIWMFFAVPYVTSHSFGSTAPVIFYLIKCLHMLLSAYQIRCGYPKRILGNVFTKSYSMFNYVAFKVYLEIPFLYILRTLLDWLCINTTLTVMEWIKMEDIFQSVFIVRCYRQMDADFPVMRGEPKAFYAKCLIGGTIIFILIALIWSPLFIFALLGRVGQANVPRAAEIWLRIGQYEPIYASLTNEVRQFTRREYNDLVNSFSHDVYATDHIDFYGSVDVAAAKFDANSVTLWDMSPPDKKRLLADLKSDKKIDIRLRLSFNSGGTSTSLSHETTYSLTKNKEFTRETLIRTLSDDASKAKVFVPDILPKFLTVQKSEVLTDFIKDFEGKSNRPIILQKKLEEEKIWWELHDFCEDKYYRNVLSNLPQSDCERGIVFYIFSDKSFPSELSFLEKTGIIGLYTTCVYVVSRVIRSLIANNHRRIMFEDLPFVDRILKLCNDIYLVRETKEYRLEEDLYGKLLFLYRSPETLIKWTRYKDDVADAPSGTESTRATSEISEDEERERRRQESPTTPPGPPTTPPP